MQPWLPLRDLKLRYVQVPRSGRVGEATMIELEAIADGARASQLPPVAIAETPAAQVFADPAQSDEQFVDGRPRTTVRRRIAVVPLQPGALSLPGPRIEWWDAAQGVARTAMLPPVQLQVAPAATGAAPAQASPTAAPAGTADPQAQDPRWTRYLPWLLLAASLLAAFAWRRSRRAVNASGSDAAESAVPVPSVPAAPIAPALSDALKQGDLAVIAAALGREAGVAGDDLDAVIAALEDAAQADAVTGLQAARWGGGDPASALAALRGAFAKGARWRKAEAKRAPLLAPLYPE